ncbi:insulinase family protein [Flavobacteriales bacterium]|nr:insulinase family protein [Flavobacteriales bacterium]
MKMQIRKINLFLGLFISLTTFVVAQEITAPTLIQDASVNPMDIPYEKWKLPNGLTVLIHEDHSDPIVQVHVTYHVGSNRETAGKSGFAHFFEHMLFQGSEHVEDERHFKIVSDAGGDMNGNTTYDRTVYFQTVPSNYLETTLWLESDRMGFLLNAVSQEKFENQRDAVTNEKYQNQINQPYGMSYEILGQNLYPPSHPYNWPVIGYVDDLDRATIDDLKDFYLKWYGPNNAYLTISGDVTSSEVIPLVEKYFGSINRGAHVKKQRANVPRLSSDVYCGYSDPNVWMPMTDMVFPTVPLYHKDEAPLDMLAALMGDGNNSIFYKNFVKSEDAIQAGVFNSCREIAGEFHFQIISFNPGMGFYQDPGLFFNEVESKIRNAISLWEKKGFTDDELEMVKNEIISQTVDYKTSVSMKSTMISRWEWLSRGKYNMSSEIKRYTDVTRDDVMRVYKKYIKNRKAVISTVKPTNPFAEKKDSLISFNPNAKLILLEDLSAPDYTYIKPQDNFDRNIQPTAGSPKAPIVPVYYKATLNNGINILGTNSGEVPKIYIRLTIDGGALLEDAKKVGLAEFTAAMMNESTQERSSEEISVALRLLGSSIRFSSDDEATYVYIESLAKNIDATLDIVKEKLFKPAFNEEDFKRIKKQFIESIEAEDKQAQNLAAKAYAHQLFGDTPFGRSASTKTIKKIKSKNLKEYYNSYYTPKTTSVIVVGDISKEKLLPKLSFLEAWKGEEISLPTAKDFDFPQESQTQIYLLDKEGASQSVIFMGHKSDLYDASGDHYKSKIVNYPLGGGASGRLFLNLREDKGYTYGVYSFFNASKYTGAFTVFSSIKTSATDSALIEIFNEINDITNNGLTEEEVKSTKSSMLNSEALKYETPRKKIGFLNKMLKYNLDDTFIEDQVEVLNSISKEELDALAKAKIHPDKMTIVIVGNKYLIKKKLENLQSSKDGMRFNFKVTEIK